MDEIEKHIENTFAENNEIYGTYDDELREIEARAIKLRKMGAAFQENKEW